VTAHSANLTGQLLEVLPFAVPGLCFTPAPKAVVRFYVALGLRQVEWLGPGVIRGIGVVFLTMMAMVVVALFLSAGQTS